MIHDSLQGLDRNDFIEENKGFIYKVAESVCKRKLNWEKDDELSISLIAFNNACDSFNDRKGDFHSYARVIIKNSLVDYFRRTKNVPILTFENEDEKLYYIDIKGSISKYLLEQENKKRAEEILLFSRELKKYKLSFDSLVEASPNHIDTRSNLLNTALLCARDETIITHIKRKQQLPIKEIVLLTKSNRKHIERWRKYILTLILILTSDEYPYIRSYLNIKAGDDDE